MAEKENHSLYQNTITTKGAAVLFDTLKECNSVISHLSLPGNQFDDDCMNQLGEFIQENEYLQALNIGEAKITDKGVKILSEYLIGNTILEKLYLNYNKGITDASAPYLIEIAKKTCISTIYFDHTRITDKKTKDIEEALKISMDKREIPIKSNAKSAAKISASR